MRHSLKIAVAILMLCLGGISGAYADNEPPGLPPEPAPPPQPPPRVDHCILACLGVPLPNEPSPCFHDFLICSYLDDEAVEFETTCHDFCMAWEEGVQVKRKPGAKKN